MGETSSIRSRQSGIRDIGRIIADMSTLAFVLLIAAVGLLVLLPTRRLFLAGWSSSALTAYFLILRFVYDIEWPFDLWLGTTLLAAISGLLLSYVAIAPVVPVPVTEGGVPLPEDLAEAGGGA